jgi:hypothetical protein
MTMIPNLRRTSLAHSLLLAPLAGCPLNPNPDDGGPPCEDDLTSCSDDTTKFVEDPNCELTGELELQLGEGQLEYSPLSEGQAPELHGGFQGGQHVWLGVRVVNADLERPLLKVRVNMDYCEDNCEDPSSWRTDNVRELVADSSTLTTTNEGWYELSSVLVQVFNWSFAAHGRIEMLVTDPCGRQGFIVHDVDGG